MATPEINLGQLAYQETQQTQKAREAMRVLRLSQLLTGLSGKMLHDKQTALASFAAMVAIVLLPRGIELASAALGVQIDSTVASMVASQGLPMVVGALTGDYLRPVSGTIEAFKQKRGLNMVRKRGDVTPEDLAPILAGYTETVEPKELKDWVGRNRLSKRYEGDARYNLVYTLYQTKKDSQTPFGSRKQRRSGDRELQDQAVDLFMKGQIEGQRLRRTPSYVAKEVAKKVGDWTVGVIGIGGAAHLVNNAVSDATTAGAVGLLDLFKAEVPEFKKQTVLMQEIPRQKSNPPKQPARTTVDPITNYNARRL